MRNSQTSKIVREVSGDAFFKRWVVWLPLILTFIFLVSGVAEAIMSLSWAPGLLDVVEKIIPSIVDWSSRSSTPNETSFVFLLAWCLSFYYAALIAMWRPYRESYVRSLVGWRRYVKGLPGLIMCGVGFFFLSVAFPYEPNCRRLCIYESQVIQIFYSTGGSMLLGYGFALIYWWVIRLFKRTIGGSEL